MYSGFQRHHEFALNYVPDFPMSRSNEDKYDNNRNSGPNNRRQYRLLSSEEVLAGKKSYWSELEITGTSVGVFFLGYVLEVAESVFSTMMFLAGLQY